MHYRVLAMGYSHGKKWDEGLIEEALVEQAKSLGRMPSLPELRRNGQNDLACAILRTGGVRRWAPQLGLERKSSQTKMADAWERHEVAFFESVGFKTVRQTAGNPFDILVNGHRVDVKTSTLNKTGWYQFGGIKRCADCDFLDLLCVSHEGELQARFIVPAGKARVTTISMMPATLEGLGKYASFRDLTGVLQ